MSALAPVRPLSGRGWLFAALAVAIVAANALIVGLYPSWQGGAAPDWPVAVDLVLLIPLLYLALNYRQGWAAARRALLLAGAGVFIGGWILPEASKSVWLWLDPLRYAVIGALLLFQLAAVVWVLWRIFSVRGARNVEVALQREIDARMGEGAMARLMRLESRIWTYALLPNPTGKPFPGLRHFHVGKQGLNASNQQAFLILIGAEIPVAHLLIALFDPMIAAVVTALSVYGFLFMLAEYRASLLRPISIEPDFLHVRYGVFTDLRLPWSDIARIEPHRGEVRRARGERRLFGMGQPNVRIELVPGARLERLFGASPTQRIYLGVDEPEAFIAELRARTG